MIGGQGDPYVTDGTLLLSYSYRYQHSDRHYRGDEEERNRRAEGSEVINDVHLMDFALTYAITDRFHLNASLPLLVAERSQPIRNDERAIVARNFTNAVGIGDLSVSGSMWVLDPEEHKTANLSIGLGVKFPTGEDGKTDAFRDADGNIEIRSVDQSIQPGDGGFGAILESQAFWILPRDVTLFAQGRYLFNPRETNGVQTGRSRASEAVMSVADQYLGRVGVTVPLVPDKGLSFLLAGRVEAVPVRDLIGGSDGFRRPGIAVSIEPGLIYVHGRQAFSVSVPVALYRNRWRSVPDRQEGPDRHGDAAFADYMLLFSYTYRFGGSSSSAAEATPSSAAPVGPESFLAPQS